METPRARVSKIENAVGGKCQSCAGRERYPVVYRGMGKNDPMPQRAYCPKCGRCLTTPIVIEYVNKLPLVGAEL